MSKTKTKRRVSRLPTDAGGVHLLRVGQVGAKLGVSKTTFNDKFRALFPWVQLSTRLPVCPDTEVDRVIAEIVEEARRKSAA